MEKSAAPRTSPTPLPRGSVEACRPRRVSDVRRRSTVVSGLASAAARDDDFVVLDSIFLREFVSA